VSKLANEWLFLLADLMNNLA